LYGKRELNSIDWIDVLMPVGGGGEKKRTRRATEEVRKRGGHGGGRQNLYQVPLLKKSEGLTRLEGHSPRGDDTAGK